MRAAWTEFALCRGYDPALFFPRESAANNHVYGVADRKYPDLKIPAEIVALCDACPAWKACRDYAVRHEFFGIWAGTTPAQRVRIRRASGIDLDTPGYLVPLPTLDDVDDLATEDIA